MNKNSNIVFISSISRSTATGINDWTNDSSGRKMKKVKIGITKDIYMCLYSSKVAGLCNVISYTPWLDEKGIQKEDKTHRKLTLQDKYEQQYNLEKGFLTNAPRKREDAAAGLAPTYFQKLEIRLNDGSTSLNLSDFDDKMRYYLALGSKFVANSEKDYLQHKAPYATHFISITNESDEIRYKNTRRKSEAFAILHNDKMTLPMKRKFVSVLELSTSSGHLTEEQVHNLLFDYIDKTKNTPGSNIEKFMGNFELLKSKLGREEFEARYTLRVASDKRVIYERQGTYTWIRPEGEIIIGETHDEAVAFLTNPKKSTLVEELEKQMEAKQL